ncbi:hypothetical protein [Oceanicola sp. 502str15]|uniref:hypothetical protein n=1 Tax=Oceanicola sp. 502str15 TaxID=2696061 RepID=UPI002095D00F|nr:hypothetical protein [Oceanicola sp. 502str15]MCO6383149.1 hypothetical protein [Oceanicola sp. 502str15]
MGGLKRSFAVVAWPFLLAGVGAFGLGGWVLLEELRSSRAIEAVAKASQPEAVAVEAFDPATDVHALGEVHVIGQLDLSMQYDLVAPGDGAGDYVGVMIPLYAREAADTRGPALGVLLYDQGPNGGTIGDTEVNTLIAQIEGEGAVGPYISVAGRAVGAGRYQGLVFDAFAENERQIAESFLTIAPFRAGRVADLTAGPNLQQPMIYGMGGTIAVLLALIGFSAGRKLRASEAMEAKAEGGEALVPVDVDDIFGGADAGGALDTGHVMIPAYGPEMADGSTGTALMRDVLALGRHSDEASIYSAKRDGIDDFAALDSGGLKRPLPGRAVSAAVAGPKPVKKASPLAAKQDPTQAADIMAAVQAEVSAPVSTAPGTTDAGDIFAAIEAAVRTQAPEAKPLAPISPAVAAAQNPFGK